MSLNKRKHIQIYVFKLHSLHNVFATYHNVAVSCRLPRPVLAHTICARVRQNQTGWSYFQKKQRANDVFIMKHSNH